MFEVKTYMFWLARKMFYENDLLTVYLINVSVSCTWAQSFKVYYNLLSVLLLQFLFLIRLIRMQQNENDNLSKTNYPGGYF